MRAANRSAGHRTPAQVVLGPVPETWTKVQSCCMNEYFGPAVDQAVARAAAGMAPSGSPFMKGVASMAL